MLKRINNEKGVALLTVVIILLVLSILSVMVINVATNDTMLNYADESYSENYYLSRSAVEMIGKEIENEANATGGRNEFITALGEREYIKYFPSGGGTWEHEYTFYLDPDNDSSLTATTFVTVTNEREPDPDDSNIINNYITITGSTADHLGRISKACMSMVISVKETADPPSNPFRGAITVQPNGFIGFSDKMSSIKSGDSVYKTGINIVEPFFAWGDGSLTNNTSITWARANKVADSNPPLWDVYYKHSSFSTPYLVRVASEPASVLCWPESYNSSTAAASREWGWGASSYLESTGMLRSGSIVDTLSQKNVRRLIEKFIELYPAWAAADLKNELFKIDAVGGGWYNFVYFGDSIYGSDIRTNTNFAGQLLRFMDEHPEFLESFITKPSIPKYSIDIPDDKNNLPANVLYCNLLKEESARTGMHVSRVVNEVQKFNLTDIITPARLAAGIDTYIITFEPVWAEDMWDAGKYTWYPRPPGYDLYEVPDEASAPVPKPSQGFTYNANPRYVVLDQCVEVPSGMQLTIIFYDIRGQGDKGFVIEGAGEFKNSDTGTALDPGSNAAVNIVVQQPQRTADTTVGQCCFPVILPSTTKTYPNCPLYFFLPEGYLNVQSGTETPIFGSVYALDVQAQNNVTFCYIPSNGNVPYLGYEGEYDTSGGVSGSSSSDGYSKVGAIKPLWVKPE